MKQKVGAIIQARTSSTRLPKKVLKKIGEHQVIDWVINRTKNSKLCDSIVLATTDEKTDDILASKSEELNINLFRGNKENVLLRYIESARINNIDIIVRICADRPFIDPEFIDDAVTYYLNNNYDLIFNHNALLNSTWPRGFGVEVFSLNLLEEIYQKKLNNDYLEHVTLYVWNNSEKYRINSSPYKFENNTPFDFIKLDLDTQNDFKEIKKFEKYITLNSSAFEIINKYLQTK